MDRYESKGIIVDERSTEEDESECVQKNISKEEDAKNEADYEGPSVTYEEPIYFDIFECGNNLGNRIYVTYEQVCMATPRDKYYEKMLETLVGYNDCNNAPFSNGDIQQAISTVMSETEAEERSIITDANNVNMDTFCQSPVTNNKQRENSNAILTSERRNNSDVLAETLTGLKLNSTINDAGYYNSDEYYAEGDPKIDPLVATRTSDRKKRKATDTATTNGNYPQNY